MMATVAEGAVDMQERSGGLSSRAAHTVRLLLAVAVVLLWSVGSAGPASAQYVTPEPPLTGASRDVQTQPVVEATSSADGAGASTRGGSRSGGSALPITGGDVLGLMAMGLGAILAGGVVLHLQRFPVSDRLRPGGAEHQLHDLGSLP